MTRSEEIEQAKDAYMEHIGSPDLTTPFNSLDISDAFITGAKWAMEYRAAQKEAHPNWISLAEQLPPQRNKQISVPVLSYCDGVIERNEYIYSLGEWRWGNRYATHWMPLPARPKGDK